MDCGWFTGTYSSITSARLRSRMRSLGYCSTAARNAARAISEHSDQLASWHQFLDAEG